jgi:UDP-N-acetylglucosamine acyltransferase
MAIPRGINVEGLKRRDFTTAQIRNVRNAYKILYRQDLKLEDALERLEALAREQTELVPLVRFVRESERSIIR